MRKALLAVAALAFVAILVSRPSLLHALAPTLGAAARGEALAARIDAAPPGATVAIPRGYYQLPHQQRISKPLTLEGERPEQVRIYNTGAGPTMLLNADVTLRGLTMSHDPGHPGDALAVESGHATLHMVRLEGADDSVGLYVGKRAAATLIDVYVRHNRRGGIITEGRLELHDVDLSSNGGPALDVQQGGTAVGTGLDLRGNAAGIRVDGTLDLTSSIIRGPERIELAEHGKVLRQDVIYQP